MNASVQHESKTHQAVLRVQGISKSFGDNHVLKDISFDMQKGEVVSLLGPSGCGKSTLLRCINWLEIPDAGHIRLNSERMGYAVNGTKVGDAQLSKMRSKIGMVFQHFALWPHMTVLENVMASPLHVQKRNRKEVEQEARAVLKRVGLEDKINMLPSRLSGGQKQRVGIARALAMKPDILLFDEPTSALDPMLVGEVLEVMRDLAAEGSTMVIVTHEMKFARQVSSRIIFMDSGHIIENRSPEEFFDNPQTDKAKTFLHSVQYK
ncbi:amino acid ABC transporter ATP-binding protein [Marinobacterium lutimaris]|uniref:Amino acid ABC transporter ATP-binding protein, PAAT family n=1 Tax=Marinobacterium lutimaris TaxID=568106 RepID=A0A1H6D8Y6_9GAMM|nr:amino acid ABC transporter ATP-binding protein [Marinobacterium lutimaris]SEG80936.1 amino acid ABC transporter ATP-binding protein, PAAT family [Marinobacterium lutimaris]